MKSEKPNLDFFEVEKYLTSRRIHIDTEGENISARGNWIGIKCLWCSDEYNHLGINLDSKGINCWRCPVKGTVIKLVMKIDNCSLTIALETIKKFSYIRTYKEQKPLVSDAYTEDPSDILRQQYVKNELFDLHRRYLEFRNFNPTYIFDKYKLMCCGPLGRWNLRLIIPFYQNNRIITFAARDVTNLSSKPYDNLPRDESIIPIKSTLYNLETLKDTGIIVEGAFDVLRIGDSCVATMGVKYTTMQIKLLSNLKRAFTLFDSEPKAQEMAENLSFDLSAFVPHVENMELKSGDPADLSNEDVKSLRKQIFGKIY